MPFPANRLEELVVEWLDLEKFATATSIFVSIGKLHRSSGSPRAGGRLSPDVVGAKLVDGKLVIRHCEAAMYLWPGQLPNGTFTLTKKDDEKFQPKVQEAVRAYFAPLFGESLAKVATYQKWIITCGKPSPHVEEALSKVEVGDPKIEKHDLQDFVQNHVLQSIKRFRESYAKTTQLPGDRWLLHLIDHFAHCGLVTARH